jgi:hypothetical protein
MVLTIQPFCGTLGIEGNPLQEERQQDCEPVHDRDSQ